jgi:hypothetical protein
MYENSLIQPPICTKPEDSKSLMLTVDFPTKYAIGALTPDVRWFFL